jgi:hypothetical protein
MMHNNLTALPPLPDSFGRDATIAGEFTLEHKFYGPLRVDRDIPTHKFLP